MNKHGYCIKPLYLFSVKSHVWSILWSHSQSCLHSGPRREHTLRVVGSQLSVVAIARLGPGVGVVANQAMSSSDYRHRQSPIACAGRFLA